MKTNELMNGDLFMYRGCLCKFVIRPTGAIFQRIDGAEFLPCIVSEIKPIPLTEEILEANGFEVTDKDEHFKLVKYERQDRWVRYKIFYDGIRRCFALSPVGSCVRIVNVHELQNALHLCKLHELADNFKVE